MPSSVTLIMHREIILMEIKCAGMNLHRRRKGDIVGMCMSIRVYLRIEIVRRFFSMSSRSLRANAE